MVVGVAVAGSMAAMRMTIERVASRAIVHVVVRLKNAPIAHDSATALIATVRIALVVLHIRVASSPRALAIVLGRVVAVSLCGQRKFAGGLVAAYLNGKTDPL